MKIIVTMPVRNEDWVLGMTGRAVLQWADELVIGLHSCIDRSEVITQALKVEHPGRVHVIEHPEAEWTEMAHRQRLLEIARDRGATHIAIVDADEILTANLLPNIRKWFEHTPAGCVLQIPWLALRGSIRCVHTSGPWSEYQDVSIGFLDAKELHWSSAGRGGYDFHHRHPMGRALHPFTPMKISPDLPVLRDCGLMHLQFVSGRRLRAKQALYQATEVLRWPDREPVDTVRRRYSLAVYNSATAQIGTIREDHDKTLSAAPFLDWWGGYEPLMGYFRPHEMPWQETELLRLLAEHGPARFAGLDFFGIGEQFYGRM